METIQQTIHTIKDDLDFFDDELQKYEYIIDLGKKLEPIEESQKSEENLVQGCTSQVWLVPHIENDILELSGTSDAVIVKGLVYIVLQIFNHRTLNEINEFDLNILNELGLGEIITPNRQSGVQGMIKKIVEVAKNGNI
ncbi:SufE family protein [Arcobacter sp. 15-2]|uniref:SufE family protein n=1 Tax=Arcobacter sp. 15-2 TaxID=3374109 RepID=UPI00399D06AD